MIMSKQGDIQLKRVYDPVARGDGTRVLVDRVWPRGMRKEQAAVDRWLRDVAPSSELRKWFGHDPERWPEFKRRYREELAAGPAVLYGLIDLCRDGTVTLLFGARDRERNQAVVLREVIKEALARVGSRRASASPVCYADSSERDTR